jgi:phage shock protein C
MIQDSATPRKLYRSRRERMAFGVAGGLAQYFNIDPVLVRLAFVVLFFSGGAGLPLYIVLALVMPERPLGEDEGLAVSAIDSARAREVLGLILAGLGAILLIGNLGWGSAFWHVVNGNILWPLLLVGLGAFLLLRRD